MKRAESHEIDSIAQRIFRSRLPVSWVERESHPDYGLDYSIEVFNKDAPTGIWFWVQLKGTQTLRENSKHALISLETDKIIYYQSAVPFPVFLFLVDTQNQVIYWLFIQKYVNEVLRVKTPGWMNQKTVTIEIPKCNRLLGNESKIEAAAKEGIVYAHLLYAGIPHWSLSFHVVNAISDLGNFETQRKKHLMEQNEMDLHLAERQYKASDRDKGRDLFEEVFDRTKGKEDQAQEHLMAIAGMLSFYSVYRRSDRGRIFELVRSAWRLAQRVQHKRFSCFFRGSFLEAAYCELQDRIRDGSIFVEIAAAQDKGTATLLKMLQSTDYVNLLRIGRAFVASISKAVECQEYWVAQELLMRLIKINMSSYTHLLTRWEKSTLSPLLRTIDDQVGICMSLADALDSVDLRCESLRLKATSLYQQNDPTYRTALESMRKLAESNSLAHYVREADELAQLADETGPFPSGPEDFGPFPDIEEGPDEELDKMCRDLARRAGIDLENDNDQIAEIVRIGLRDRNPERVLKTCSHLEVAIGAYGMPGQMLGLPTAGSKFLFCKYGTGVFGMSLDQMYEEEFKQGCCTSCRHHDPMPAEWRWSLGWQRKKHERMSPEFRRFIDAVMGRS